MTLGSCSPGLKAESRSAAGAMMAGIPCGDAVDVTCLGLPGSDLGATSGPQVAVCAGLPAQFTGRDSGALVW